MIFGSNPSVYTLPGTWETQPFVPVECLMAGISIIKIRRKKA